MRSYLNQSLHSYIGSNRCKVFATRSLVKATVCTADSKYVFRLKGDGLITLRLKTGPWMENELWERKSLPKPLTLKHNAFNQVCFGNGFTILGLSHLNRFFQDILINHKTKWTRLLNTYIQVKYFRNTVLQKGKRELNSR